MPDSGPNTGPSMEPQPENTPVNQQQAAEAPRTSNKMRNYTLAVLTLVYAFNFIDRQILIILLEDIKADFTLADWQLGLLSGTVFAIFYVTVGLPIAYWADRGNRRNIITLALTVWSGMTALTGLAQNYSHLLLARIGVGVGEAGGSPPAHSMITDLFSPKARSTALSIYSAGLYLGIVIGYIAGGFLSEAYGWRATFMIVGIPGVFLALLLRFTVREPGRGTFEAVSDQVKPSFKETLQALTKLKSFPFFAFGCAMSAFVSYGTSSFMPSLLSRYHDIPKTDIAIALALTGGLGGIIGSLSGGYLTDRFGKDDVRWYLWIPGFFGVGAIPLGIIAFQSDSTTVALITYFLFTVMGTLYLAPSIAVAHRIVHPRMRAMTSAVLFFVLNLIGLGLGPLVVGGLSTFLAADGGPEELRLALTIAMSFALIKAYLFWKGGKLLPEDIRRVEGDGS